MVKEAATLPSRRANIASMAWSSIARCVSRFPSMRYLMIPLCVPAQTEPSRRAMRQLRRMRIATSGMPPTFETNCTRLLS